MPNYENNSNNQLLNELQDPSFGKRKDNSSAVTITLPKQKLIILVIAVIAVIAIIFAVVKLVSSPKGQDRLAEGHITVDTVGVLRVIEKASDLVVLKDKYIINKEYTKSATLGDWELPFGAREVFISFTSEFGIGFDVSDIKVDVNDAAQTVTITLPEPTLLYDTIDMENAYVKTTKKSLLVKPEDKELLDVMNQFQKEKEAEIINDESLLNKATDNAQNVLQNLLVESGVTQNYRIIFQ